METSNIGLIYNPIIATETRIRYVLYARKSTESDEQQALSIDSQVKEMTAIAERLKLNVVAIKRESHSAKASGQRPIFKELLEEINKGIYNGILTWAPDRLSRNAGDLGTVVDLMDEKKLIHIQTFGQTFSNSPNEKFLLMILCSQAKLENDNKSINVKRGLRARVEMGLWPCRPPTGYTKFKRMDQKCESIIDPLRAPVIKQIFEKVGYQNWSGRKVFHWLKHDIDFKTETNMHLSLGNLYVLLSNTFYYGKFEFPKGSGNWYNGAHEPIISKELYDLVQTQIKSQIMEPRSKQKEFAFTKIMTCGLCGSGITADEKFKKHKDGTVSRYVYYKCTRTKDSKCKSGYINEDDLIKQLQNLIDDLEIHTVPMREKISSEVKRFKSFESMLLGRKSPVVIKEAIGSSGIVYMLLTQPSFLMSLPQRIWSGTNSFIIIAMPLFMITGELMNHSGLTKRLINFALLLVRPFKGGLAEVNIVASMIFGGITGSSVADTSAIGSILIPDMIKKGYSREFSTGVTVASSTMGMIIPPSIPMLMYSMVSGASVGKLFLAGVIPGLLVGITQLVYTYIISKKRHYPQEKGMLPLKETLSIAKDGSLAVLMPLIIIVSVSAGIATASESAGIALLYAMLLGFFVYKELKVKAVIQSLKKTAVMTSSIMIIGGFTMIFTWVLAIEQVPAAIASFLLDSNIPFWLILLLLDLLILFLGTFLDVVPCILLIAPILLPVMRTLGMEELQFGIIMIVGLAIGLVTPPVGMCLNVGSKISGLSILEIFKDSLPFLVCNVLVLLLVTFVPSVSLLLPSLI